MAGADGVSRSWFCVFNNPEDHGFKDMDGEQICEALVEQWVGDYPNRSCAFTYCVSERGMKHVHAVIEDSKPIRFSAIKKIFESWHIEPTKGTKEQAEDYINARGKYAEKGEKILATARHGEIKGAQGKSKELEIIETLLDNGLTPQKIMDQSLSYRRHDKIIKEAYYRKRILCTPTEREVNVTWHVGDSGSGKSYIQVKLIEKHGEDGLFLMSDYTGGGFDNYNGEKILFMDEFRGQIKYNQLLVILDKYKSQVHARYTNAYTLWDEVHITSVLPPERVYSKMVSENADLDNFRQLKRRITTVAYHYQVNGEYFVYEVSSDRYTGYQNLKDEAIEDYMNTYNEKLL